MIPLSLITQKKFILGIKLELIHPWYKKPKWKVKHFNYLDSSTTNHLKQREETLGCKIPQSTPHLCGSHQKPYLVEDIVPVLYVLTYVFESRRLVKQGSDGISVLLSILHIDLPTFFKVILITHKTHHCKINQSLTIIKSLLKILRNMSEKRLKCYKISKYSMNLNISTWEVQRVILVKRRTEKTWLHYEIQYSFKGMGWLTETTVKVH